MRITEVGLTTGDLDESADFWGRTFELPVERGARSLGVRIGESTLTFEPTSDPAPVPAGAHARGHHVAFTIPSGRFDDGVRWLRARVPLLGRDDLGSGDATVDDFRLSPPPWNSRSVYFPGPDGLILELIARYSLPASSTGEFSSADLICISEIGLATSEVLATAQDLTETLGVSALGDSSPDFAPLGDQQGLLIVVQQDRVWFPTQDIRASPAPVTVTVDSDGQRSLMVTDGRVRIERAPASRTR